MSFPSVCLMAVRDENENEGLRQAPHSTERLQRYEKMPIQQNVLNIFLFLTSQYLVIGLAVVENTARLFHLFVVDEAVLDGASLVVVGCHDV